MVKFGGLRFYVGTYVRSGLLRTPSVGNAPAHIAGWLGRVSRAGSCKCLQTTSNITTVVLCARDDSSRHECTVHDAASVTL